MAQWFALKKQTPSTLLFFRMGDFYELFFDDAIKTAQTLDLALTHRGSHQNRPIPMCGVPVRAGASYLARLVRKGYCVAIAEQKGTPQKGQKGPLPRHIVRIVTPGTLTEEELLESDRTNFLLALSPEAAIGSEPETTPQSIGAAWCDISTGAIHSGTVDGPGLAEFLARLDPAEIISDPALLPPEWTVRRVFDFPAITLQEAQESIETAYPQANKEKTEKFSACRVQALGWLLHYVRHTQGENFPRLEDFMDDAAPEGMALDPATRASLELLKNHNGQKSHTLFAVMDETRTSFGARMLGEWIASPLTDPKNIQQRQEGWLWLAEEPLLLREIRTVLAGIPDYHRALGRLGAGKKSPRDAGHIRTALQGCAKIRELLASRRTKAPPILLPLFDLFAEMEKAPLAILENALQEELPLSWEEGSVIKKGHHAELDRQREFRQHGREILTRFEKKLQQRFSLNALRVRHHAQLGFVIETPINHAEKLTADPGMLFRHGTTTQSRFVNAELLRLAGDIQESEEKAGAIEREIFEEIRQTLITSPFLGALKAPLAQLDVLGAAAEIFLRGKTGDAPWCRPILDDKPVFLLEKGRHPVVEQALRENSQNIFIPNDCRLSADKRLMLLTGPNMAGKSTFLRQNALAAILAQAGLPVPAKSARIGVIDRLFSRVGAADDLARGRSTFMVEMMETAEILNHATERSMVVVDEIGRGTSTLDGLSIAWATLEHLHSVLKVRGIFATHFHELGQLPKTLHHLCAFTMGVEEWENNIVFLHEIKPGTAEKSWGIHVAAKAGIPAAVTARAENILHKLEDERKNGAPLFSPLFPAHPAIHSQKQSDSPPPSPMAVLLEKTDPDALSPREAHALLYRLKDLC